MIPSRLLHTIRNARRALTRARVARVIVGTWLALHGFVVAAAPLADALEGHATSVTAHWEDAQDTSCPPQHDPATCQLCQQVSTAVGDASAGRIHAEPDRRIAQLPPNGAGLGASDAAMRGSPSPRGPPEG